MLIPLTIKKVIDHDRLALPGRWHGAPNTPRDPFYESRLRRGARMKTRVLLATSLVAFLVACGARTDVSIAHAGAGMPDAGVDASVADANSTEGSLDASVSLHVRSVAAGGSHTCVILDEASVKCWGYNLEGQLGLGDKNDRGDASNEMGDALPKVDLGTGHTAKAISAGKHHTCVILDDDGVKCWGYNSIGQLGLGDKNDRGDTPNEMGDALPKVDLGAGHIAKALSAGDSHTCVILDDDSVKCWGYNSNGQLGLGDKNDRGDGPNEMGDMLPKVDLGAGHTAKALSTGNTHTCVILDDNGVKCWGYNEQGQLGLGDMNNRGAAPNEMGDVLAKVDLGQGHTAKALSAGYLYTCAILDDNSVKCWGNNELGALGLGDKNDRGDGPNEMGDMLLKVDLGAGHTATALSAGTAHTCAILDDNSVKCWGNNELGALGLGDTNSRGDTQNEMGDMLPKVDVGAGHTANVTPVGSFHTCVILDDNSVKCWGYNAHGQLGLGDKNNHGDAPNEMGDMLPKVNVGTR